MEVHEGEGREGDGWIGDRVEGGGVRGGFEGYMYENRSDDPIKYQMECLTALWEFYKNILVARFVGSAAARGRGVKGSLIDWSVLVWRRTVWRGG